MKSLIQYCLPQYCRLCLAKTQYGVSLCRGCESELDWLKTGCYGCAAPIENTQSLCGLCASQCYFFDRTISAFHYTSPIDQWIKSLKFNRKTTLAPLLARCLWKQIQQKTKIDKKLSEKRR